MSPALDDALSPDDPPTTKEGWRRFVDYQPEPPPVLTGAELLALTSRQRAAHDEARRDYHAALPLVNTPTIRQVLSTGRLLAQLNRRQISARRGAIISGASGTGKTTALTQLGRTHERAVRKRHPDQPHRLPVIYVTVPPAATARMLAVEFARFFGLEFSGRANITDVVNAVCATAAYTGVELVLVDEIHNISLTSRTGAEVSDQLKYFAGCRPRSSTPASKSSPRACSPGCAVGRSPAGSPSSAPPRSPTAPMNNAPPGGHWCPRWRRCCGYTSTTRARWSRWMSTSTDAAAA
jgi:hypothetical protein